MCSEHTVPGSRGSFLGVGLGPAALGGGSQGSPGTAAQTAPARSSLCPQPPAESPGEQQEEEEMLGRAQEASPDSLPGSRSWDALAVCWIFQGERISDHPISHRSCITATDVWHSPFKAENPTGIISLFSKKKPVARKELKAAGIVKNLVTPPDTSPRLRDAPDAPTAGRVSLQSLCTSGPSPGHCSDISALALGAAFPSPRWLG